MSTPQAVRRDPGSVPPARRAQARLAVCAARALAHLPPRRLRAVLRYVRRGARPARTAETLAAREAVTAVSLACTGPEGCLPRSLATVLLCRLHGRWPVWCVGARRLPPFGAHAWVEAEGRAVGEEYPDDYFRTLFSVP